MENVLNVSFNPSKISKQLDLIYIDFKSVCQASSILPDALVRDLRSRTGRETVSI